MSAYSLRQPAHIKYGVDLSIDGVSGQMTCCNWSTSQTGQLLLIYLDRPACSCLNEFNAFGGTKVSNATRRCRENERHRWWRWKMLRFHHLARFVQSAAEPRCSPTTWAVGLQEFGTVADMERLMALPTFNTLAIAKTMKAAIKKSDPAAHVWCKLVLSWCCCT